MFHVSKHSLFTATVVASLATSFVSAKNLRCPAPLDPRLVEILSAASPALEGIDDIFEGWLGEMDNGNGPAAVVGQGFRSVA